MSFPNSQAIKNIDSLVNMQVAERQDIRWQQ